MFQTVILALVVAAAAAFVIRGIYRWFSGKGPDCACSSCGRECPYRRAPNAPFGPEDGKKP